MENRSKKKKTSRTQSTTVEMRINDFPDDILTHILSFLPFKDAFRTTVLSKRWVSLCYKLSNLEINDEGVNNAEDWIHFRQFVDAIILSPRSKNVTLESFNLRCSSKFVDCVDFDKLVEAAKQRHVECLDLCLLNVPLAPSIFCCETLVVLKIGKIKCRHFISLFSSSSVAQNLGYGCSLLRGYGGLV
jgi:hypothetical protein